MRTPIRPGKDDHGRGFGIDLSSRVRKGPVFQRRNFELLALDRVNPLHWSLAVDGLVGKNCQQASILETMLVVTFRCVLQCAGNRRGLMVSPGPGLLWSNDAVALVEFTGVPASVVIPRNAILPNARYVLVVGADGAGDPDDCSDTTFSQWFSVSDFLQYGYFVFEMNGKPLVAEHGGPLRFVMRHHYGNSHVKHVRHLRFLDVAPHLHFRGVKYMVSGTQNGTSVPVGLMLPCSDAVHFDPDSRRVRGIAYGGLDPVTDVFVCWAGNSDWVRATSMEGGGQPTARELAIGGNYWRFEATLSRAPYGSNPTIICRARTISGVEQPMTYNREQNRGYHNNAVVLQPISSLLGDVS